MSRNTAGTAAKTTQKTALVAGATGASAKRLVETLTQQGWRVIGISRHPPAATPRVHYAAADLHDANQCRDALAPHAGITHLFYTARAKHGESGVESVEENVAMLRHVVEAAEQASPVLEHVHLVEGTKWYGMHIGPFKTPAREDDARHMPPNFYYDQQDFLTERQTGTPWGWSASRPGFLCDFAPERPRNIVSVLGAYGAICRELDVAFDYPGSPASFASLCEVTSSPLLARAMVYLATAPQAANQAFNVTNGDVFRWQHLWPQLAAHFGVRCGEPRALKLGIWMADKAPIWQRIVARHGLVPSKLADVAVWEFADFVFGQDHDVMSSVTKIRQAGFHETIDTQQMLLDMLGQYRRAKILP